MVREVKFYGPDFCAPFSSRRAKQVEGRVDLFVRRRYS
jgi:hypothetical protein